MRYLKSVILTVCALLLGTGGNMAYGKKPLDHDAFDGWEEVTNYSLSQNGEWAAFRVYPEEGDGVLTFYNIKTGKKIEVERGTQPKFTADSKWAVASVLPQHAETRKAKIEKKKDLSLPQKGLAIINLTTGKVEITSNVTDFKIGEEGGNWVAYQSVDTCHATLKQLEDKKSGKPLIVRNLNGKEMKVIKWVEGYAFSKDGSKLAMTLKRQEKDTLGTDGVGVMLLPDTAFFLIDRDKKFYSTPVFDEKGNQLAYVAGNDSVETGTKQLDVFVASPDNLMRSVREIKVEASTGNGKHFKRPEVKEPERNGKLLEEWAERQKRANGDRLYVNQYSKLEFSKDGKRLIVGVAPYVAPDDTTIVTFERAELDIWRWDALKTPPQEKANLKKIKEKQLPVVIDLKDGGQKLVTTSEEATVWAPSKWDGNWALVEDPTEGMIESQWNYLYPETLTLVNVNTGEKREVATVTAENSMLSPADKFVAWYDKRNFYAYNISNGETVCISKDVEVPLWDEDDDHPMESQPYGVATWAENDEYIFVYDKYDIWALDPTGMKKPFMITAGEGRKTNRKYRYQNLDSEQKFVKPGELMLFRVFDYGDKRNGLATITYNGKAQVPDLRLMEESSFLQIRKAKKANSFSWVKGNFEVMPDVWVTGSLDFKKAKKVSAINPQKSEYSWGTAQLFKWYAYDGQPSEGVLYLPEDFDPAKEYPMLSVFYETGSQNLYYPYTMEPSWSWVNYPFYVSRGYVVFVPDIHYTAGLPGENAYNYVCSGVEAVCDKYPNIDRKRIGIDGQSWGGYQTAYLVTRTNMFACAGSGAPVSNMTSAFGGIRWESGNSRQSQYEMGQSRIGRNLWEAPELYIANSPVFHADRCNTPLLIMHNDADGAVPWYQGIELFMALRRLQKPVWMLQYNGEAHNLKERRNKKDITIRLQQFFDHYLKGDPMPKWMREGISPLRKGQEMGY